MADLEVSKGSKMDTLMSERIQNFKVQLKLAAERYMVRAPRLFALELHKDSEYLDQFADHMIEKVKDRKVYFINETVQDAMINTGVEDISIDGLYGFLGIESVNSGKDLDEYPKPPRMRGC